MHTIHLARATAMRDVCVPLWYIYVHIKYFSYQVLEHFYVINYFQIISFFYITIIYTYVTVNIEYIQT